MSAFLAAYGGTILIGAIVLAVVVLAVVTLVRRKKRGQSSCGCGCDQCPSSGMCHKPKSP